MAIGVNERGEKKPLALADAVPESKQIWREVLLGLSGRGLTIPPKLAAGDDALGFSAAVRAIYPETQQQRCWLHNAANVLNYPPKSLQPKAKALHVSGWLRPKLRPGSPSSSSLPPSSPNIPRRSSA